MRVALGFDTSCYTTSAAAVDETGEVICSSRMLLPVPLGQRGLRQSEAVFAHVRQMPAITESLFSALRERDARVVSICVSSSPRDDAESYMPVFTVGLGHARVLANMLGVPLFLTSHQRGHIAAGQIGNPPIAGDFVSLHLSGGTTELLYCGVDTVRQMGGSLDLHAGQLVDRIGVAMGLGFPAGPALEGLAVACAQPTEALLPVSMEKGDLFCHFSGAEAAALRMIREASLPRERIAAEVFDLLARTVARLLIAGCKSAKACQSLVVGGVASSELLRTLVKNRLHKRRGAPEASFGQARYSADNAAGVAWIGMRQYLDSKR